MTRHSGLVIVAVVAVVAVTAGMAACATPGQVRQVQTQVAILDRDNARADSARAADLARIEAGQRRTLDSMVGLVRELNDRIQHVALESNSNFDNLRQQLYQVSNLSNTTQRNVARLGAQVETALTTAPPVATSATDTSATSAAQIPAPDVLLQQAVTMLTSGAYDNARFALNTLLKTYPTAAQVPDAVYYLGYSFDPDQPDSARIYYNRVWNSYPDSPKAPTALFKLGNLELKAQNLQAARGYWQQIVDKYKQSDEYQSALDALRENP
ncbi:MAG: tetratricopeptide repeat protein [Gemmatimonadales bacterium]